MEYFALLGLSSAAIAGLAVILYRRTQDVGIIVGIGALYYWSLYGAWFILIDKTGGFSGKHYHYLEQKLFAISLDGSYLEALALYAGFILTVELTLLAVLDRRGPGGRTGVARLRQPAGAAQAAVSPVAGAIPRMILRHEAILVAGSTAAICSFLLIQSKLSTAWALNTSAYWYTRSQADQWFTLHQVLNRIALIPPAIGIAALLAGRRSMYFTSITRSYTWPAYAVLLGGMAAFTFVLGNKNEVFTAMLAGFLAYLGSVERRRWGRVVMAAVAGLWFLYAIDFFRATPVSYMQEALAARLTEATGAGEFVASSNEAFAAHFSMYGVLASHVQPKFGYSIYSLACSVIPRVLWPARPHDIYIYYVESVGAIQNQGYSLHHATGWYLNFGPTGVFLGAAIMGLIWAAFLGARHRIRRHSGLLFRLFATIAPWMFAAGLPPLLRAGPEGYKGVLIESVVLPVAVLLFACRPGRAPKMASLAGYGPAPYGQAPYEPAPYGWPGEGSAG